MPKILYETTPSLEIKHYKTISSRDELDYQLRKLEYIEAVDYEFVRIVLTLKKVEIVIHHPKILSSNIITQIENPLNRLHYYIDWPTKEKAITLDIMLRQDGRKMNIDERIYDIYIFDVLKCGGKDLRNLSLKNRRQKLKEIFPSNYIRPPRLFLSTLTYVYPTYTDWELLGGENGTSFSLLFNPEGVPIRLWEYIAIRNEKSIYDTEANNDWILIDVQKVPKDLIASINGDLKYNSKA